MLSRRALRTFATALTAAVLATAQGVEAAPPAPGSILAEAPPPTPVPPDGSPSPFPSVLHTPDRRAAVPPVRAPSFIIEDLRTGQVLLERGADDPRPIASVTKVMTALVVLDRTEPEEVVTVTEEAVQTYGSVLGLRVGERIPVSDLLYALMLQSANDAARALAVHVSGSVAAFVRAMNRRAASMGLRDTRYASPNGLDNDGYSSARDLAVITRQAYLRPLFADIVSSRAFEIPAPSGPVRHIQNRNALLWLYPGAAGVKTGFTTPAGHCLVATAFRGERALLAVVLGDPVDAFDDAAALMNYGFAAFRRLVLARKDELLRTVSVEGLPVPVVAARHLTALIRTAAPTAVKRAFRRAPELSLPVHEGQSLGRMTYLSGGIPIGRVAAVAGESVMAPPPATRGRADLQPFRILSDLVAALVRSLVGPFL